MFQYPEHQLFESRRAFGCMLWSDESGTEQKKKRKNEAKKALLQVGSQRKKFQKISI